MVQNGAGRSCVQIRASRIQGMENSVNPAINGYLIRKDRDVLQLSYAVLKIQGAFNQHCPYGH